MKTYYGYARVSTVEQGTKYSIENQRTYLSQEAKKLNLPFVFYSDTISGATFDRPEWNELKSKIKSGDILGVQFNDRIGRDTVESLKYVKEIFEKGVEILVGGYRYDFNNPNDELSFTMFASFATFQRKNQKQKSLAGITKKKESGEWVFTGKIFGYQTKLKGGRTVVEVDKEEAEILQYIFLQYSQGDSSSNICKILNEKGKTYRGGTKFYPATVRRWLLKPIYMGYYKPNVGSQKGQDKVALVEEELIKSKIYPAIIDKDLWLSVNRSFRNVQRNHSRQFTYRYSFYELAGLLVCGHCKRLHARKTYVHCYKKGRTDKAVACYVNYTHIKGCGQKHYTFQAEILEELFRTTYYLCFAHNRVLQEMVKEKENIILANNENDLEQIKNYHARLRNLDTKEGNLVNAIAEGYASIKIREELDNIRGQREEIEDKIQEMNTKMQKSLIEIEDLIFELQDEKLHMFNFEEPNNKRKSYQALLNEVEVYRNSIFVQYKMGLTFEIALLENRGRKIQKDFLVKVMYKDDYWYTYKFSFATNSMQFFERNNSKNKMQNALYKRYQNEFNDFLVKLSEVSRAEGD